MLAAVVLLFCSASWARAQDWAKAMFSATSYDFGTVACGAKVEHRFSIENIYSEDAHIKAVNSSCGCAASQINKRLLKKREKAELVAVADTRKYLGHKDATITVVFDKPFSAEVHLQIQMNVRGDLVVQPGTIQFGSVRQGTAQKQEATISHCGRKDWQITKIECANPHIQARVSETSRAAGSVKYALSTVLKADAPAGYFQDQLVLVTNDADPRSTRVPVSVDGKVESALSVSPSQLLMGRAEAGQAVTRSIVVKGDVPFRVVSARSDDRRFQCKLSGEAKTVHVIPVTFVAKGADSASGTVHAKIRIETDMAGSPAEEVAVSVQVVSSRPGRP